MVPFKFFIVKNFFRHLTDIAEFLRLTIDLPRTTLYNERKRNAERNYTVKSDLKRGLSGSTLKLIALSSMLIDTPAPSLSSG